MFGISEWNGTAAISAGIVLLSLLGAPAGGIAGESEYTRNVAIVIWNGAEILDWAGPSEVFQAASHQAFSRGEYAFHVYTVSKTTEPITSQMFVRVIPEYSIEDAPRPDIVVFPGGGVNAVRRDPEFLAWAKEAANGADVALSVCTGAFILGDAGLLDGREATTWYGALEGLENEFPEATVHRGRRYVDNGQVVTTAGVSAGIDGALHVVARLLGRRVADQTAQYMEYRWTPEPYLATDYATLNPALDDRGRALQQAAIHRREKNELAAVAIYRDLLDEEPEPYVWMALGNTYLATEEFAQAVDAYGHAVASPELAANAHYNAACASARLGNRDAAVEHVGQAITSGYRNLEWMRNDPDLESVRDDPRFAKLVAEALASR